MKANRILSILCTLLCVTFLAGCATFNLPEDGQLYVGIKDLTYDTDSLSSSHFVETKTEIDAALACPPSSALFGSSKLRSPFPVRLWIYNAFANYEKGFGAWMKNKFGSRPKLISDVNPDVRVLVAKNLLDAYGYFGGSVRYTITPTGNAKKAYISYNITTGPLYRLHSVEVLDFPQDIKPIVEDALQAANICVGAPFSASMLQDGKHSVSEQLRDSGYYYSVPDLVTYTADSLSHKGSIMLRVSASGEHLQRAYKKYYIGDIRIQVRRNALESLSDSLSRRQFTLLWSGEQPLRPNIILRDIKLRKGQKFSSSQLAESQQNLMNANLFSSADWRFTPRKDGSDTLDLALNAVLEKPLDGTFEANFKGKSNGMIGPQLRLGLTKRNIFRGGETLTGSIFGTYEWQTNSHSGGTNYDSYEYGADLTLEFPRIELPWNIVRRSIKSDIRTHRRNGRRRRYFGKASTDVSMTYQVLKRPDYFKINTFTFRLGYKWQTAEHSVHEFSPLVIDYSVVSNRTQKFDSMCVVNPILARTFDTRFIPQIKYSYIYTSPARYNNPLTWRFHVGESGNLTSLAMMLGGKKWDEKDKKLFSRSYGQFIRIENELTKIWHFGENSNFVGHIFGGVLYSYGNSHLDEAPYQEFFYCGGANSMRAFPPRGLGPGGSVSNTGKYTDLFRVGSIKLEGNIEYRFRLIGDLHGAAFVDVGNVWNIEKGNNSISDGSILKQLASDVGVGLRYDLHFLVIRADWACALHLPYETSKTGYFNVDDFSRNQNFHIAIGYPF